MKIKELEPNAFYDMAAGMPHVICSDNDGSWIYRYNIAPHIVANEETEEEEQIGWQCREIRIWEQPTKSALKKYIIRSVIDENHELAIINDYNKHILRIKECEEAVERYKSFLVFTEEIDEILSIDFKE